MSPLGIFGPKTGHKPLFADLCQYHGLDKKTKLLLKNIVLKLDLQKPAELFVDPTILTKALKSPDFADSVDDLQELYNNWFAD